MRCILPHQDVLVSLGVAPSDQVREQICARSRPKSLLRRDRFYIVRRYFGVIARKRFCGGHFQFTVRSKKLINTCMRTNRAYPFPIKVNTKYFFLAVILCTLHLRDDFHSLLTEYRRSGAPGLTRATVYVEIRVSVGPPLPQNTGACMNHVHKMGIRFV